MPNELSPYPSIAEILHQAGKILETTPGEKLVELIKTCRSDYKRLNKCQQEVFSSWKEGSNAGCPSLDQSLRQFGEELVEGYKTILRTITVDGLTRDVAIPWLLESVLAPAIIDLCNDWMKENLKTDATDLLASAHPVGFAFEWLKSTYPDNWGAFYSSLSKDRSRRDKQLDEFGNGLYLAEQAEGLIVDWDFMKDQPTADTDLVAPSLERLNKNYGTPASYTTDRGFDSASNRAELEAAEIYNGICPRSVSALKEKLEDETFRLLQKRRGSTEGRIGLFKSAYLGRPLRAKGYEHRKQRITLCILGHNLWKLATMAAQNRADLEAAA